MDRRRTGPIRWEPCSPPRRPGRPAFPWSGRAWRALAFANLSVVLNCLPLGILAVPWVFSVPVSLLAILASALIPLGAVVLLGPWLSVLRRGCFREVMGVDIPKPAAADRPADRSRPARTGISGRDTFRPALATSSNRREPGARPTTACSPDRP